MDKRICIAILFCAGLLGEDGKELGLPISRSIELPALPQNIISALHDLANDENYQLIENYVITADIPSLIILELILEQTIQTIQSLNQSRTGIRDLIAPLPWLLMAAFLYFAVGYFEDRMKKDARDEAKATRMLKLTLISLIPPFFYLIPIIYTEVYYNEIHPNKKLGRIMQLRYAIQLTLSSRSTGKWPRIA
jgi:hypothetical protein